MTIRFYSPTVGAGGGGTAARLTRGDRRRAAGGAGEGGQVSSATSQRSPGARVRRRSTLSNGDERTSPSATRAAS